MNRPARLTRTVTESFQRARKASTIVFTVNYSEFQYHKFISYLKSSSRHNRVTPSLKTLWYCTIPLVAITATVSLYIFVPLPPIKDGFMKNGLLPAISFSASGYSVRSVLFIFQHFLPEIKVSRKVITVLTVAGGLSYASCLLILNTQFCYPFPFSTIVQLHSQFLS